MAKINSIQINTNDLPAEGGQRYYTITGAVGAQVMVQVITNEGLLYNFENKTFVAEATSSEHINNVTINVGGTYSGLISFPSGATTTYSVIMLTGGFDTTIGNSTRKSSITKIVQNSNVTLTLAVATATAARYSSDPAASNITSVGAKATASSVVVNPVYEITNASSDAQGFGFSNSTLGFSFSGEDLWYFETTETVDGAVSSSSNLVVVDDLTDLVVGMELTYITGTTAPGAATTITAIDVDSKTLTLSRDQALSDGATMTFRAYGSTLINNAIGCGLSIGTISYKKGDNVVAKVRTDPGGSVVIPVDGTYGIGAGVVVKAPGIRRDNSGDTVFSVNSVSSSAGEITVGDNDAGTTGDQQTLPVGLLLEFGSHLTAKLNTTITVTSYPDANRTINLDLDKIVNHNTAT